MDESRRISGKSSFIGILERFDRTRTHEMFRFGAYAGCSSTSNGLDAIDDNTTLNKRIAVFMYKL